MSNCKILNIYIRLYTLVEFLLVPKLDLLSFHTNKEFLDKEALSAINNLPNKISDSSNDCYIVYTSATKTKFFRTIDELEDFADRLEKLRAML